MPYTPGVSVLVTVDPVVAYQNNNRTPLPVTAYQVSSDTWNPTVGIEVGRTAVDPDA
jgi:hypothetical protein